MTTAVKSWSFSRYSLYSQCPLKFKFTNIDKLPEPKGPALLRGSDIHDKADRYLKGTIARLPVELAKFKTLFAQLRAIVKKTPQSIRLEETWAFKADWTPTRWDDWNGCHVRIKTDVTRIDGSVVTVYDWKSGKFREDGKAEYDEQLELYALGALVLFGGTVPNLIVQPKLVYLDAGSIHPGPDYTVADLPALKKTWARRVKPLMVDTQFAPKPNRWCPWCEWRASNSGPCKF